MQTKKLLGLIISILLLPVAFARPPTPCGFGGTATLDGIDITPGTLIEAFDPDAVLCGTFIHPGGAIPNGFYGPLFCNGDDPDTPEDEGAKEGDKITFYVNGNPASAADDTWTEGGTKWNNNLEAETGCTSNQQCDDGEHCNGIETCNLATSECQDGTPINCNDGVSCTDDSCNENTDSCDYTPNNSNCDDGVECTDDVCDAQLDCQYTANDANCDDGVGCTDDTCDALLDCQYTPNDANCDDQVGCTDDVCDALLDCQYTPDDANCDDGLFCNGAEICCPINDCLPGDPIDCSDALFCTVNERCDEALDQCVYDARDCSANNLPEIAKCTNNPDNKPFTWDYAAGFTSICDEINNECTQGAYSFTHACDILRCDAQCEDNDDCDDNECSETYNDYCDGKKLAEYDNNKVKDSTTVQDSCQNSCEEDCTCTDCQPDCSAPSTNKYCVKDVCNAECGSDDDCTGDDVCDIDSCECTESQCLDQPDGTPCDNGLHCDGDDECQNEICVNTGPAVVCEDNVDCTDDSCDEATGGCKYIPNWVHCDDGVGCTDDICNLYTGCENPPQDAVCDDGLYCNGVETCDALLDCQAGIPIDCDDNVDCTDDSCDEATDSCDNTPDDANCDDGLWCNGAETCDALLDCQAGTQIDCDDSVDCTDDTCDEDNDECDNDPNDANCDDNVDCTDDTCDALLDCQYTANDANCDDQVGCTDDTCDALLDCQYTANDANCDDGLYCNGVETCDALLDCQDGVAIDCDDNVDCTDDSCDEDNDDCDNIPDDAYCDDGLYCNGDETCDTFLDCQDGTPIDCSPNNIDGIATCDNNPDTNPFTWDFRQAFASVCDEVNDECTQGDDTITHKCDILDCGAQCEEDTDCNDNDCSETYSDYCNGKKLAEYDNDKVKDSTTVQDSCENTCQNDCSCTDCAVDCSEPSTNQYCVKDVCEAECDDNSDCDDQDPDTIDICIDDCTCSHITEICDNGEDDDGDGLTDCKDPDCLGAIGANGKECCQDDSDCDNNQYCDGAEYCSQNNECEDGTAVDCSGEDISGIATCDNNPDDNPLTWDYRDAFASVCDEVNDQCTSGDDTITHTCDIAQCDAECEQDSDCACAEQDECIDSDNDGLIDDYVDYPDQSTCQNDCTCADCDDPTITEHDPRCKTTMKIPIEQYVSMFSLPLMPDNGVTFNDIQDGCTFTNGITDGIAYWDPLRAGADKYVYINADTVLFPGQGYFTTQENECEFTIEGYKFTMQHVGYLGTNNLFDGWDMIGAPSDPINDFDLVEGNCNIVSGPWGFDAPNYEYFRTQRLEPGKGYFTKTTNNCNLG